MDKRKIFQNIQFVVLIIISISLTIFYALYKHFPVARIVLLQMAGIIGILYIRFAYGICYIHNVLHSIFHTRNGAESDEDNEPSDIAIIFCKLGGYIALIIQIAYIFVKN